MTSRSGIALVGVGTAAAGPQLTAALLGGCRVVVDGSVVDTGSSRRTRVLLAYLLTHRRAPVPRDVLMEVFWPTATPAAARNSLHVALSGLRQVLRGACGQPMIERRFDTYALSPAVDAWVDVDAFEVACRAARRAAAARDRAGAARGYELACQIYAGDLLAGDPYLDWALPVRERLRRESIEAQWALMELYVQRALHGPAAVLGRAVLVLDPAHEAVHRSLMVCLAATGQRHLALAQYQKMVRTLWRTFRAGPSADSTALYEALRSPAPYRFPA